MDELKKFKHEVDQKLKDHQNMEQQKTDLERHIQALIKVLHSQLGKALFPLKGKGHDDDDSQISVNRLSSGHSLRGVITVEV